MNLRFRGPSGVSTLKDVDASSSVAHLLTLLEAASGIAQDRLEILAGFPPKPLDLGSPDATVSSLGLQSGDVLTVRQGAVRPAARTDIAAESAVHDLTSPSPVEARHTGAPHASLSDDHAASLAAMHAMDEDEALARAIAASMEDAQPVPSSTAPAAGPGTTSRAQQGPGSRTESSTVKIHGLHDTPALDPTTTSLLSDGSCVVRRVIESDNSCLFNAVGYGARGSRHLAAEFRLACADAVRADPATWSEAVLEKPRDEYCAWISDPRHWGGAIELSILAKHLGLEVAAFDIQTQRMDVYGTGEGYAERLMVIYDGLHYDSLALAPFPGAPEDLDVTLLPAQGPRTDEVMAAAAQLVAAAHAARQFTDTGNFGLRCGVCGVGLRGEREALQHARSTGHADFTEY